MMISSVLRHASLRRTLGLYLTTRRVDLSVEPVNSGGGGYKRLNKSSTLQKSLYFCKVDDLFSLLYTPPSVAEPTRFVCEIPRMRTIACLTKGKAIVNGTCHAYIL